MNGRSLQVRQDRRRDVAVVREQVALRDPLVRPERLVEVRELQDPLALPDLRLDRRSFALHLIRLLVLAQPLVHRRPQPAVVRPLGEAHLGHELGLDPDDIAPAHSRHLRHLGERRVVAPQRLQLASSRAISASSKPVPTLPAQRRSPLSLTPRTSAPNASARSALPLRVPRDHELLPSLGLQLQPVAAAPPRLVARVGSLGHDPLEALLLGRLVERWAVVERSRRAGRPRWRGRRAREPLPPLGQRQVDQRRPLHLEQVERDVEVRSCPPCPAASRRSVARPSSPTATTSPSSTQSGRPECTLERADDGREAVDERLVVPAAQVDVAAADRRDRPEAVPLHLEEPALAGRHVGGERRQHRRVARRFCGRLRGLLLLDEQPVLRVAAELRRHERPEALEPLAVQTDGEAAVRLLLDELVRAAIPDLDRPGAVVPGRDLALEAPVGERVVLDVDGEVLLSRARAGTPFGTAQLASAPSRSSRKS